MQNEELLTVRDILDDDYGCEELPLGAEPMVTVILTDDHGAERSLRLADSQTRTWRPGYRIMLGAVSQCGKIQRGIHIVSAG